MPDRPATPAAVLRAAADLLDTNPALWGRDYWLDPANGCRCSGGLIGYVVVHGASDPYVLLGDSGILARAAVDLFEQHVYPELLDRFSPDGLDTGEPLIGLWNDRIATGPAHVAETMRAAAAAAQVPA